MHLTIYGDDVWVTSRGFPIEVLAGITVSSVEIDFLNTKEGPLPVFNLSDFLRKVLVPDWDEKLRLVEKSLRERYGKLECLSSLGSESLN